MIDRPNNLVSSPPNTSAEALTRPTRFLFWATAPFFVAFLVLMPLLVHPPTMAGRAIFWGCELLALLVFLGFMAPVKMEWCLRTAAMLLFLAFVAYFVSEAWIGNWDAQGANALKALLGMVIIGLPALRYALWGAREHSP